MEDTCGMEEEETIGAGTECGEAVGHRGVDGLAKDGGQESEIEGYDCMIDIEELDLVS